MEETKTSRASVGWRSIEWAGISALLSVAIFAICCRMDDEPQLSRDMARRVIQQSNASLDCKCSLCEFIKEKGDCK